MSGAGLEFWVYLPQMRMSFSVIGERARAAEAAGFDGVALMDHLAPPGLTSADTYDAMTTAAAVAAGTERLKVGHLVLCGSFRHPCVLAKEVVSLDRVSTQHPVGLAAGPGDVERVTEVARRRFGGWGGLITGTAERVAQELTLLARRGVERFYLQFSDFAEPQTLERFGAEVIPAVRGAGAR